MSSPINPVQARKAAAPPQLKDRAAAVAAVRELLPRIRARARQVDHALEEIAADQHIKAGGRLVEDQERGVRGQRQ